QTFSGSNLKFKLEKRGRGGLGAGRAARPWGAHEVDIGALDQSTLDLLGFQMAPWRGFSVWPPTAKKCIPKARAFYCRVITAPVTRVPIVVCKSAARRASRRDAHIVRSATRWPHKQLVASSTRKPRYRHQYEHDYSSISHVCRPMSAILNRKPEQEWYREKKESDVT